MLIRMTYRIEIKRKTGIQKGKFQIKVNQERKNPTSKIFQAPKSYELQKLAFFYLVESSVVKPRKESLRARERECSAGERRRGKKRKWEEGRRGVLIAGKKNFCKFCKFLRVKKIIFKSCGSEEGRREVFCFFLGEKRR